MYIKQQTSHFGSRWQQAHRSLSRLVVTWCALLLSDTNGASGRAPGCDCGDRFARLRVHLGLHWERHFPRFVFRVLELVPVPPSSATRCASWCRGCCLCHRHRREGQGHRSLSCGCACVLRHGSRQVLCLPRVEDVAATSQE